MTLKVLSMNIHKGFSINQAFTLPLLQKALAECEADVIFLQEVVGENLIFQEQIPEWPRQTQSEYLAHTKFPHHVYGKNAIYKHRHHGNAILSHFPIVFSENISLTNYRLEQRGLLHCSIEVPDLSQPLHLFNVHLDLTGISRRRQIQKIIARAQSHVPKDAPLILAGDFNDWTGQATDHFWANLRLEEAAKAKHGKHHRSFPSFFPLLQLDRIYFRHLKLLTTELWQHEPWPTFSDHLPILTHFETP